MVFYESYYKEPMRKTFTFQFNNEQVSIVADESDSLLSVIRYTLNKTGTKYSCGIGQCGACTVLINGQPERSCMIMMEDVGNSEIITIEGLSSGTELHPIQKAFVENDALQCGYCTPGMIMNAYGLILKNPTINRDEILKGMEENLCRCGSYNRILDAIESAAKEMNEKVRL